MMKTRHFAAAVALGGLLAIALGVFAQAGYPSRIRAQAIGLGAANPTTTNGTILGSGSVNGSMVASRFINSNTGAAAYVSTRLENDAGRELGLAISSSAWNSAFLANGPTTGEIATLFTGVSTPLMIGVNGTANAIFPTGSNRLNLIGTDTIGDNYLAFWEPGFSTRKGYVGFGGADNDQFYIVAEESAAIIVQTTGPIELAGTSVTGPSSVDMTPATGTFAPAFTDGCTTTPAPTFRYSKMGRLAAIGTTSFSCTSDSTNLLTGAADVPAAIRPTTNVTIGPIISGTNNGTDEMVCAQVMADGTFRFWRVSAGECDGAWTNSGTKAIDGGYVLVYPLD